MGEIANPMQEPASGGASEYLTVKVMLREQVFEITGLSPSDAVGRLKEYVASATEVPVNRQRLIFSGRSLTPEDKPLSFFHVTNNSKVHLFPLPAASPVPVATPNNNNSASTANAPATALNVRPAGANLEFEHADMHTPLHFNSAVQQQCREVKLWSLLLLFLSMMALFNNLSYFSATGKLGSGNLDTVVFVLDTMVSGLGSWVGMLGLKSVRTLDLADVRKYVRWLGVVAVVSMIMRILWVFDVVYAVQRAVKNSENAADTGSGTGTPDSGTGGETGDSSSGEVIDKKAITAFGIQATLVAMICLFAWSSCFRRAVSFYRVVAWHDLEAQQQQSQQQQSVPTTNGAAASIPVAPATANVAAVAAAVRPTASAPTEV